MNDSFPHPEPEQLAAYGLGKLEDGAAAQVHQHLEDCDGCRAVVEPLPDDTLASLVRASATLVEERPQPGQPPPCSGNGTPGQTSAPQDPPVQEKVMRYDGAGRDPD